jgi:hypothetical protein
MRHVQSAPRKQRAACSLLVHRQEAVVLYAPADLERVSGAPLRLARQRPDRQISVEVLEDLKARTLRVVPEQIVEVFEARSNPARRRSRKSQAGLSLERGQLET